MLKRYGWFLGILFGVLSLSSPKTEAQSQQIRYGAEASVYGSGDDLPFWFYSNADGKIDPSSSNLINQFYSYYTYRDTSRSLQLSTGFDLSTRFASNNALFFRQLFASVNYHWVSASAGRFYDPIGLNDHDLSMGSTMVSRNATPVPKVRLGTDGFVNLPWTDGHLQLSGMLSHGWLEGERYISNPYLHQKFLYLKYQHKRFDITAGAVHNVVWGGTHPGFSDDGSEAFKLPSSFSDYLDVLVGQSASEDGDNIPDNEITNTVGNSVAAYEAKLGINFEHFRFKLYRQFYLEDKVALAFRSPWDGMWGAGVEFDNPEGVITEVLWEHMNTKRQNAWEGTSLGRSNYYNNGVYRSGWTYEGRVMGNPLIINGPAGGFDGGNYPISNNIIVAHHLGIKGKPLDRLTYKAFFTYSRNYGTSVDQGEEQPYTSLDQLRRDQYSSLLQLNYLIAPQYGLSLQSALAFDIGELYDDNRWGFQIGVRWNQITSVL
jgi:hypothetical protein